MNSWEKYDSTGQYNDYYYSFASEKFMSPLWNLSPLLFISEDNLLQLLNIDAVSLGAQTYLNDNRA